MLLDYASQHIADADSRAQRGWRDHFPAANSDVYSSGLRWLAWHPKVAPDGTAFVPDKGCASLGVPLLNGGEASVIVSEDNNLTWQIRTIPGATTSGNLPNRLSSRDRQQYDFPRLPGCGWSRPDRCIS